MKERCLIPSSFRLRSVLSSDPPSYLVQGRGRCRRERSVLKQLPAAATGLAGRLRPDFLDLLSLKHPALGLPSKVVWRDGGDDAFLSRPFIEGSDALSATKGSSPQGLLPWFLAFASALEVLHRFGSAHGNLKPSNLIVPRGHSLARSRRGPAVVLCDPAWMYLPGEGRDPRGEDLAALGGVFFHLLTGSPPAPGASPSPPSSANPAVPLDLDRLVLKLLRPQAGKGYPGVTALIEDLLRLSRWEHPAPAAPAECFLDRRAHLARAREALFESSGPRVLAVTGEAGIGKSSFLHRLSLEAQVRGLLTVEARPYAEIASSSVLGTLLEELMGPGPQGRRLRSRYRNLLEAAKARVEGDRLRPFLHGFLELVRMGFRRPAILLIDEVQEADRFTMELLSALIEEAARANPASTEGRPAFPRLVVSYRDDPSFRPSLAPVLEALRHAGGAAQVLELAPLEEEEVEEWLSRAGIPPQAARETAPALRGNPLAIREALRALGGPPRAAGKRPQDPEQLHAAFWSSLGKTEAELLERLALLGRPAEEGLLAVPGVPEAVLPRISNQLLESGVLLSSAAGLFFRQGSLHAWILKRMPVRRARVLHRRIALALEGRRGVSVEELAGHWLHSDSPRRGIASGLRAARSLDRSPEAGRALAFYRLVLARWPAHDPAGRRKVAAEAAAAHSRAGRHREAVAILRKVLPSADGRGERAALLGRIGIYRHRAGGIDRAIADLEQAAWSLRRLQGSRSLRDRLSVEAELAEIANNAGEYERAEAICRRALRSLRRSPRPRHREVRRAEMLLVETWAHLELRRYRYGAARALFEKSLRASRALGAEAECCLILNNLGILHNQENRFHQAIECYREAERRSIRQGGGQILVNIHSNLALLYAKTGRPREAERALMAAEASDRRSDSGRARFLRLHSEGVVLLELGRYDEAIQALREAIAAGQELKDHHVTRFDLVYLGQCHLLRGEYRAALKAFSRSLSSVPRPPGPIAGMAAARRAAVFALTGEKRRARAALDTHPARGAGPVPYLEAWNRLFRGWSFRLLGEGAHARRELEEAVSFFSGAGVPLGEAHASLELLYLDIEAGHPASAERRLRLLRSRFTLGEGPFENPMLAARFLAYQTKMALVRDTPDLEEASGLLAETEGLLIGRHLRDLETLVRDLKRSLRDRGGDLAVKGLQPQDASPPEGLELPRREQVGPSILVGRSTALKSVLEFVDRVAANSLPVLISGETGTGKDLLARAIHHGSSRREGPLITINCAAMPVELVEAELFGFRKGAFSGAVRDHPGLLAEARGGTFLFDDVSELPPALQGKLLRVLDQRQARPIGGEGEVEVDVRYLFTSNRDLRVMVDEGLFRRDLFFRLSALELRVPPLRERREDIPELVEHFRSLTETGRDPPVFEESALRSLAAHSWPGNVRELKNVVTRLVLTSARRIDSQRVRSHLGQPAPEDLFSRDFLRSRPLEQLVRRLERDYLLLLHSDRGGDLKQMARTLGITRRALYKRFKVLGIRHQSLQQQSPPGLPGGG